MSEDIEARSAPGASYEPFDTQAGFEAAVDRLLVQPGRELRVFDPDLGALRLNAAVRVAGIERFVSASRARRLYIALHDPEPLARYCPRMLSLLKRYAHCILVQRTHEEIRELRDAFLVLDAAHCLRRPEATMSRGVLRLGDRVEAFALRSRFEEIWAASEPVLAPTTLGL